LKEQTSHFIEQLQESDELCYLVERLQHQQKFMNHVLRSEVRKIM
jgi:hypothetical protein